MQRPEPQRPAADRRDAVALGPAIADWGLADARFDSLFHSLPVPALVVDALGLVRTANEACESLLGVPRLRAGRPALMRWLLHADDRTRLRMALDNARQGRGGCVDGVEIAHGDEHRTVDLWLSGLAPLQGEAEVVVTLIDQTERLHTVRQLQAAHGELMRQQGENRQLAEVARLTGQLVMVTDPQFRITWVNEAFCRLTGWRSEDVTGRTPDELLQGPDTDRAAMRRIREQLDVGLPVERTEILNYTRDGRALWLLMDIQPMRDEAGRLTHYVAVQTDITARRAAEEALRRSDEQQRALFDAEPHALLLMRRDGGIVHCNAAARVLFGIDDAQPAPTLYDRLAPEDREAVGRMLASVVLGGPQTLRLSVIRSGLDALVPVELHGVPVLRDGGVGAVLAVARDISDELAAQALRMQHEEAEAASRAKSRFIARMSHELRTPLNAILGFAQLLEAGLGSLPQAQKRQHLTSILGAGRHLLAMINDLLDLSLIESDRVSVDCRPVALRQLAQEALDLVAPMAAQRGIEVALVAPHAELQAVADPVRLMQVLANLLSNGVKYNRPGGRVELRLARLGEQACIDVVDDGIGLSEEQRAHLFEPFNRLGAERRGIEGTGIGLVIARRLAELMGGGLGLLGATEAGSAFRVTLPVPARADAAAPPRGTVRQRQAVPPAPGGERHVLYVEDDEVNALLLEAILARQPDWRLTVARDGHEGLRLAREIGPDVVLLDMQLPDIDGLQVRDALAADPATAGLPCLLLTADATESTRQSALQRGFIGVEHKPLVVDRLLQALARACDAPRV